ncbi:MAG: hypothetical protein ABR499_22080, partial [Gemmatimonadaceae bacterium]
VGVTPFDGEDAFAILMNHIKAPVPRPKLRTDEEREVFAVIERLLAKEPGDRFQSGEEVVAALNEQTSRARVGRARTLLAAGVSPTQPARAVEDPGDPDSREPFGPEPSVALDRALQAGLALIKQQGPKLGLRRRLLGAQWPRARAAVAAAGFGVARVKAYGAARGRRFWAGVAASSALLVGSYYGAHFATKHRSRCAVVDDAPTVALQGKSDDEPSPRAPSTRRRPLSVLVDAIGEREAGDNLDVYYDVCGLEKGSAYTATVTLTKNESGFRRLLGSSVEPIRITYDETARGPAARRHRTLDLGDRPPGSYWLDVTVRDANGRRRSAGVGLLVSKP